jgi:hypothetical protein
MIELMIVDQSETSAIDEAEVFVIISNENQLRRLFNASLTRRILMPAKDFMNSTAAR